MQSCLISCLVKYRADQGINSVVSSGRGKAEFASNDTVADCDWRTGAKIEFK